MGSGSPAASFVTMLSASYATVYSTLHGIDDVEVTSSGEATVIGGNR